MSRELIKTKENFWSKITVFFRNIFYFKNKNLNENLVEEGHVDNSSVSGLSKEEFMGVYQKAKNKEIDLTTLDSSLLEKICKLLEEEVALKKEKLNKKLLKIKMYG